MYKNTVTSQLLIRGIFFSSKAANRLAFLYFSHNIGGHGIEKALVQHQQHSVVLTNRTRTNRKV